MIKTIREIRKKLRIILISWIERTAKICILFKVIYKLNIVPIKISVSFFIEFVITMIKFMRKLTGSWIEFWVVILINRNKAGWVFNAILHRQYNKQQQQQNIGININIPAKQREWKSSK